MYAIIAVVVAAIALGVWLMNRPRTYEGVGEVIYTDADGTYQLVLKSSSGRYEPITQVDQDPEEEMDYRFPLRLYINHKDSGADASGVFLQKVESATAEFIPNADNPSPWICTQPAPHDALPDAALVTLNDFTAASGDTEQVWTIRMKNGDTITMRMPISLHPIPACHYYPEEAPMDTVEQVQALIDQVSETVEPDAVVYLHLPAVTYEGGLVIGERQINLYGSTEEEGRTTFTGNLQVTYEGSSISIFDNEDFAGNRTGVGISAEARVHLRNCNICGWKTGVSAYGNTWVSAQHCRLENNTTDFHFNTVSGTVTYYTYTGNEFADNGTAVLLESVPGDTTLFFDDSLFSGNDTDIDNRCGHSVDISRAIFESYRELPPLLQADIGGRTAAQCQFIMPNLKIRRSSVRARQLRHSSRPHPPEPKKQRKPLEMGELHCLSSRA